MKAIYDAGSERNLTQWNRREGWIHLAVLCRGYHGGLNFFDYGYGPFRWVCLSGKKEDLIKTDRAAMECIPKDRRGQDMDNWIWIRDAKRITWW